MILLELFWNFFVIGLLTFGGGYSSMAMIEEYVVNANGYMTHSDLNHVFAVSEMTPGPFSLNAATFVGGEVAGTGGAVIATIGFIMPSVIIVLLLSVFYVSFKENRIIKNVFMILNTCIIATLSATAINIITSALVKTTDDVSFGNIDIKAVILFGICCLALVGIKGRKLSPIFVILGAAVAGAFIY